MTENEPRVRFAICEDAYDFAPIPVGAKILGITNALSRWELADRCTLGVIGPGIGTDGRHTVVHEILQKNREHEAFFESLSSDPGPVWVVGSRKDLETVISMVLLNFRARAFLEGEDPFDANPPYEALAFAKALDHAQRCVRGWEEPWPGPQAGYTYDDVWMRVGFPEEVRTFAIAYRIVYWIDVFRTFTLTQAMETLSFWFEGRWLEPPGGSAFVNPEAVAAAAVEVGKYGLALQAAAQCATRRRYERIETYELAKLRPEPLFDGRVALLDLTSCANVPDDTERVGWCVAPVVVRMFRDPEGGTPRFAIFTQGVGHFRATAFRDALEAEYPDLHWKFLGINQLTRLNSPSTRSTALTREAVLELVRRHLVP